MTENIKNFYSLLQFPGQYTQNDLQFYEQQGIHNRYLKDINSVLANGQRVLDVGCGTGMVTNIFAKQFSKSKFVGVDFSDSIDYAINFSQQNKIKNVSWVKQDFLTYSTDNKFDVIICCGVLHHIPKYLTALEKIKSMLSPNGKLVLAVYNPYGKVLKRLINIKYHNHILYQDQENNPFELSFTHKQVLNMCNDLSFISVQPSINNKLVDLLACFNSENGGLASYVFNKQ
jgi:ubiquinone/menaquinone biosynthesis C-methylase UbiE